MVRLAGVAGCDQKPLSSLAVTSEPAAVALQSLPCALCCVLLASCSVLCASCSVQCASSCSVLCAVCCVPCAVCNVLLIVCRVLHALCCVLLAECCVPCDPSSCHQPCFMSQLHMQNTPHTLAHMNTKLISIALFFKLSQQTHHRRAT